MALLTISDIFLEKYYKMIYKTSLKSFCKRLKMRISILTFKLIKKGIYSEKSRRDMKLSAKLLSFVCCLNMYRCSASQENPSNAEINSLNLVSNRLDFLYSEKLKKKM